MSYAWQTGWNTSAGPQWGATNFLAPAGQGTGNTFFNQASNNFNWAMGAANSMGQLVMPNPEEAMEANTGLSSAAIAITNFYLNAAGNPMASSARSVELLSYGFCELEDMINRLAAKLDDNDQTFTRAKARVASDISFVRKMQDTLLTVMMGYLGPQGALSKEELRAMLGGRLKDPSQQNNIGSSLYRLTFRGNNPSQGTAGYQVKAENTKRFDESNRPDENREANSIAGNGSNKLQQGAKNLMQRARLCLDKARTDTTQPFNLIAHAQYLMEMAEALMSLVGMTLSFMPGAGGGFSAIQLNSELTKLNTDANDISAEAYQRLRLKGKAIF